MATIARILCPIDFSDFSRRALDYAVAFARWYGASVTALHVHQPPLPTAVPLPPLAPVEPLSLPPIDLDLVRHHVAWFVGHRGQQTAVAIEPRAVEGEPAREVLAAAGSADRGPRARRRRADVRGRHAAQEADRGPAAPSGFLPTAQHVVRGITCPVLIVRHASAAGER